MKKLFVIIALLIGLSTFAQSKSDYCKLYQIYLEDQYPGTKVTYEKNVLIVTFKLDVFAENAETSIIFARNLVKDQESMNEIGKAFSKGLRTEYEIFNEQGFYFVKFRLRDSKAYNYKLYVSINYKI